MPGSARPTDPLLPRPLVVTGHLVTFDPKRPEIADGALYVDRDGIIQGVQARTDTPPAGFDDAARVDTAGFVYPGLIDLHNHIAYNCLPLWIAQDHPAAWDSRDQWPRDKAYKPDVSLPANALCHASGKAVLKYVETKAVVGGVTAIQGCAKVAHPFEGWMVRNVEDETFVTGRKSVNQSVRQLTSAAQCASAKHDLDAGHAYLYHLSEGTAPKLVDDYDFLRDHDVLAPRFVGIHATALGSAQFAEWHRRASGGSIVWSPFSNIWLYGETTDVIAARKAKLRVCLGADWSPSGSKSLLGELKVADLHLKGAIPDPDLCAMATCNPADALGWADELGRLRVGLHADFVAMRPRPEQGKSAYRTLIESTEPDVLLVAINGYPMYGVDELMQAANAVNPEPIDVSPALRRTITLRDDRIQDADMGWSEIVDALEAARADPGKARAAAVARAGGEHALLGLRPDKEWDDPTQHPELLAAGDAVTIPELDTLTHDDAYLARVEQATIPAGKLAGLRAYYAG